MTEMMICEHARDCGLKQHHIPCIPHMRQVPCLLGYCTQISNDIRYVSLDTVNAAPWLRELANKIRALPKATQRDQCESCDTWKQLHNTAQALLQAQVDCDKARRQELERCCGVLCEACANGEPIHYEDGRSYHMVASFTNPSDKQWKSFCPADAIRALSEEE